MQSYNHIWVDYNHSLELFLKSYLEIYFPEMVRHPKLFPLKLQTAKLPGYLFQSSFLMALGGMIKKKPIDLMSDFEKYYQEKMPQEFELVLTKPGFINMKISNKSYDHLLLKLLTSASNKIPLNMDKFFENQSQRILIDYSSPNIAKELHVGHLRSTIIGESVARLLEYQGCHVLRRNHLGDWGMPLGMLIEYLLDEGKDFDSLTIKELGKYYSLASQKSKKNLEFKERAKERTFKIQSGDLESQTLYQILYQTSLIEINKIYRLLGIDNLVVQGESFYHLRMKDMIMALESEDHLKIEENGLKLYFPTGCKFPLVLEKSEGGFTYDTSDLTALKYRLAEVKATKVIYVVDSGQQDHLENVFQTAKDFDWIKDYQEVTHLKFGLVLGSDGKKLSSRNFYQSGEAIKSLDDCDLSLSSFLEKAVEETCHKFYLHFLKTLDVPDHTSEEEYLDQNRERISKIAISSIKYSEFCKSHQANYKFDFKEMLTDQGKTALHVNYTYARLLSIYKKMESWAHVSREQALRKIKELCQMGTILDNLVVKEIENIQNPMISLVICFSQFNSVIEKATREMELHYLADYLFELISLVDTFYQNYRVMNQTEDEGYQIDYYRLLLVEISIRMIETLAWILNLDLACYI
jgi:arginyl-tRNA synthetase